MSAPIALLQFGATGQLGDALARMLAGHEKFAPTILGRDKADFTRPDDIARAVLEAPHLDLVVNATAYTAVDKAEEEEALAHRINAETVGAMAKACAARGVPLIHVSTDYVYDGTKPAPYREDDATHPMNAYGRTKLAGEEMIAKHLPAHVILRTSWVYSGHGRNFLKTMLRLGAERDEVRVVADQYGAPTAAGDLASAILAIGERLTGPAPTFGVFHFAGSGETSWYGFAEEIFAQAQLRARAIPISTADYPTPARRPANSRLDTAKISRTFDIHPPAWQSSLAAILAGMKETGT
ncbi:MAG TPA: dTDP-4-dehydrorhamnose reductase [Rhizomicrobium sp.]